MKLNGMVKGKVPQLLIDSGSTPNFLNANVASKFGCKWVNIVPAKVMAANVHVLECKVM